MAFKMSCPEVSLLEFKGSNWKRRFGQILTKDDEGDLGWVGWDLCAGLFYEHRFAMLIIGGVIKRLFYSWQTSTSGFHCHYI